MGLETGTYISDLVATNPAASDPKSQGDDHLRLIKSTLLATLPNVTGAITPTHTELNYVDGVTSAIQTQLDAKAPLASPTFTGTVVLPSTTSIGNVSATEIGYVDGVTSAIQTQLDAKAPLAGPTFTGTVVLPSTTSIGSVSATELGYLDGVTSAIQTQINALSSGSGWQYVSTQTASSSSSITFTGLSSNYDYMVTVDGVYPTANGSNLYVRFQNSGADDVGSNYTFGGYRFELITPTYFGATADNNFRFSESQSSTASNSGTGVIEIYNPSRAAAGRVAKYHMQYVDDSGNFRWYNGAVRYLSTSAADGIKFYFSSNNITAGTFTLYKLARS